MSRRDGDERDACLAWSRGERNTCPGVYLPARFSTRSVQAPRETPERVFVSLSLRRAEREDEPKYRVELFLSLVPTDGYQVAGKNRDAC